jgi:hypothetical protein
MREKCKQETGKGFDSTIEESAKTCKLYGRIIKQITYQPGNNI